MDSRDHDPTTCAVTSGQTHTPGPWAVELIPDYQGFAGLVGAQIVCPDYMIAEVRGAVEIDGRPHGFHAANARLIAAAPDLYEVVRDAESCLSTQLGTGNLDAFALTSWLQYGLLPRIRAAIAKATGASA